MPKHKLTDSFIRNYPTPDKRVEIYDEHDRVTSLAIRITKTGHKSFVFRYRFGGMAKRYTIGKFPVIGLSEARAQARELYKTVVKGEDPLENKKERRAASKQKKFVDLAEDFMQIYFKGLRPKTQTEYKRIIENELIPAIGKIPVDKLKKSDFIELLDKKAITDESPTMANRISTRLHTILEFGISRDLLEKNPARGLKKYEQGENRRKRVYNNKEIRELWKAFDLEAEPARTVFKMLLICAQRSTETRFMRWDNIHDDIWTIPAELSKSKREHHVPLPAMALDLLKERRKAAGEEYVFEGEPGEPLKSLKRPKERVRTASGVEDFIPHDLRRTATSRMAELKTPRTVLGKILNHKGMADDDKVIGIYDRYWYLEEKREALERWSNHLQQILDGEETKIHKIG